MDNELSEVESRIEKVLSTDSTTLNLSGLGLDDLPQSVQRVSHEENKARLIPVVVRQCGWARYVGDIQGLPKAGRPVKQWPDKDQAFFDVEEGLRKAIDEVRRLVAR